MLTDELGTIAFRLSTLAGLVTIAWTLYKLITVIQSKAKFEQRVETHIEQTEPLIAQFHAMQNAVTSGELRHQAITERLSTFIETQTEANSSFRETLNILIQKIK